MSQKMCYTRVNGINLDRDSIIMNELLIQTGSAMLIDGVLDFQPDTRTGVSITAYHHLTETDTLFDGHFPGKPICPGHNLLQMCLQTAQLFLFCLNGKKLALPEFFRIKEVTNRYPAVPGDTLYLTCIDPEISKTTFTCTAFVKNQNGKTVAQVDQLTFSTEELSTQALDFPINKQVADFEFVNVNDIYLSASEIQQKSLLPHRGRALLIDGITAFQNSYQNANITSVCNIKQVVHFSGSKYLQGHLMLEMAYLATAMFHYCLTRRTEGTPAPMRTENIEFLRPAKNGETLFITCKEPEIRTRTFSCSASIRDQNDNPVANIGRINGIAMR